MSSSIIQYYHIRTYNPTYVYAVRQNLDVIVIMANVLNFATKGGQVASKLAKIYCHKIIHSGIIFLVFTTKGI